MQNIRVRSPLHHRSHQGGCPLPVSNPPRGLRRNSPDLSRLTGQGELQGEIGGRVRRSCPEQAQNF